MTLLRSSWMMITVLTLLLAFAAVASVSLGASAATPWQAWQEWRAGTPLSEAPALGILLYQRLPRTLAAVLAGAGLAIVGCAFQAILRNPLATPYTLGVASAGALGAWCAMLGMDAGWWAASILGVPGIPLFAFLFSTADILLIAFIAAGRGRTSPHVLLLAGVTLGMLANSGIMLTRYLARPDRLVIMDHWLLGGVDVLGYKPITTLAVAVIPCGLLLLAQANRLDQFSFSEELAAGRGVPVRRLQWLIFLVGSLLTALIVSEVGPIGFVGLIVPHALRVFTGPRHRLLLPCCALGGAAFLTVCDIAARRMLPGETPIGIITTLIGGPFFLYLLGTRRFTDWRD